ncbi:MAG: uroporphyrinogen decarboxylase family protein [Victivallales bacterium]
MTFDIVPQDEAWVKQAKQNLTALYEGRPLDRIPFEFMDFDITSEFKPKTDVPSPSSPPQSIADVRREFFDEELQLRTQLESIARRVREGFWDDKILALHPIGGATGWMTEVFGGETVWFPNRPPYPHHVIAEAHQIDTLRPDFEKSELYQAALRHLRFFRKAVGDKIPIGAPDLQSPIDVASMIFDYTQLIYAMMDEPRRVHSLMRMITDAIIQACHAFRKEMTDYPMSHFDWWMPRGIWLSDDLQAVLSPDLYREFAVPYNEILASEFGGLATHSCGRIIHNVENVAGTKGMMAFNSHDPLARLAPIVKNRVALVLSGVVEVFALNHPECKRPFIKDAESLEKFWWEDFEKLPTIKGQRVYYWCHVLRCNRPAREAYERMLCMKGCRNSGITETGNLCRR